MRSLWIDEITYYRLLKHCKEWGLWSHDNPDFSQAIDRMLDEQYTAEDVERMYRMIEKAKEEKDAQPEHRD